MDEIVEIKIPNLGPNDEFAYLTEWFVKDGEFVEQRKAILNIETTKSNIDLESEASGYLYILDIAEQEVRVGKVVGIISSTPININNYFESNINQPKLGENIHLSKKAKTYIEQNNIDISGLKLQDDKIYSEKEIKTLIEENYNSDSTIDHKYYNENSQSIVIYGGGGHAKMCIDIIKQTHLFKIEGIVDDVLNAGDVVLGIPVLGGKDLFPELLKKGINKVVLGIGAIENPFIREKIYFELKDLGFELPNIIHPKALIEPTVKLGEGNQIMANAVIGSNVKVGNNNIVNSGAIISHDSIIQNSVHITPGAILAGNVKVANNAVIGMGATIYFKVEVGSKSIIFNNCRVTRNVMDNEVVKENI